jgi:hypothetical protein
MVQLEEYKPVEGDPLVAAHAEKYRKRASLVGGEIGSGTETGVRSGRANAVLAGAEATSVNADTRTLRARRGGGQVGSLLAPSYDVNDPEHRRSLYAAATVANALLSC